MKKVNEYTREELIEYIEELENKLKSNKYGLYWDKSIEKEEVEYKLIDYIPYLNKIDEMSILNGGLDNILIEGDNYHALSLLNMINTSDGLIDIIYIDPPYNTGNKDFIYNDKFVDLEDGYRHSKWLNFMEKRLVLCRQLLKKEGVIFISIDDNEYANLKLLCDRIWGINNYIGTLIRKTVSQRAMAKHFNNQHEYCLIYSSNKDYFPLVGRDKDLSIYKNPDNDPNGEWKSTDPTMRDSKNNFGIKNPYTDRIDFPPTGRGWAFTKESFEKHLETGKIVFKRNYKKNERGFIYKSYKKELRSQNLLINSLEFSDNQFLNQVASKEQVDIFNDKVFDYPKPSVFIKELISYYPNDKNPIILDFFAGSGTTGQAVLELNKEDGGNRRFILCTNNENNICTDVTYQRLKTVITGVRNDNSKYSDGLRGTLHYYKCDFIPNVGNQDQAKYNLVEKVNHLLCILENTFELVVIKSKYFIYRNVNLQKYLYIYIDYYDQKSFDDFKDEIINTKCNSKVVYIYSNDSVIDESLLVALPKIEVKVIPSKIYEIYREIVEEIKRG